MIRAKFRVESVVPTQEHGDTAREEVTLRAVHSPDQTSPNYTWSQYTPTGALTMTITNRAAFGRFAVGAEYCLDFTSAE